MPDEGKNCIWTGLESADLVSDLMSEFSPKSGEISLIRSYYDENQEFTNLCTITRPIRHPFPQNWGKGPGDEGGRSSKSSYESHTRFLIRFFLRFSRMTQATSGSGQASQGCMTGWPMDGEAATATLQP